MKALILFSSRDGQAREIASYIANEMKARQACDVGQSERITTE